jgi:hypothetical protein
MDRLVEQLAEGKSRKIPADVNQYRNAMPKNYRITPEQGMLNR